MVCEQIIRTVSDLATNLPSAKANTVLLAAPILVGTVSLVLQYISHRNSVLDSKFERERKIEEILGGSRPYQLDNFTTSQYSVRLTPDRVRIKTKQGRIHSFFKYLNPFGELQGNSLILFEFELTAGNLSQGPYKVSGFPAESGIEEGVLIVTPHNQVSIFAVDINTVNQYQVSSELGNLWNKARNLDLDDFQNLNSQERVRLMHKFF
jgi:hypothetical protein